MTFPPPFLTVDGTEWQCYMYANLVDLKRPNLQMRAQKLQAIAGAGRCPPLRAAAPNEDVARWVVNVQAAIATATLGVWVSAMHYGAPAAPAAPQGISTDEEFRMQKEGHNLPLPAAVNPKARAANIGLADATSSNRSEYVFSPTYTIAAANASAANIENKQRNRAGELSSFMFRDADHVTPTSLQPHQKLTVPPFQTVPPGYRPGTVGTIAETSYQPPPPGFQRRGPIHPQQCDPPGGIYPTVPASKDMGLKR